MRRVRREGSYIYEEFMPTGGTDVKVVNLCYGVFREKLDQTLDSLFRILITQI